MVGNLVEERPEFIAKDTVQGDDSKLASRIGETIGFFSLWSSALLIIASVITVVARVYFRYVVNHDLVWADAFLTLVFEWIIFLGIPRVIWKDTSPRIGIARFLPERFSSVKELLGGAQAAIEMAFFWLCSAFGCQAFTFIWTDDHFDFRDFRNLGNYERCGWQQFGYYSARLSYDKSLFLRYEGWRYVSRGDLICRIARDTPE